MRGYVYLLECCDGKYYVGVTNNLARRLKEHDEGIDELCFTVSRRPVVLKSYLVFDNFYATGTRTVRGMEALALSLPPTPGRSLLKRPRNESLFTLGSILRAKGYDTAFIYSGYGYFDNMNYFFDNNGYRVIDRNSVSRADVTFANVWGACDEDLYRWTMREADAARKRGRRRYGTGSTDRSGWARTGLADGHLHEPALSGSVIQGLDQDLLVGRQGLDQGHKSFDTLNRCVVNIQDHVIFFESDRFQRAT